MKHDFKFFVKEGAGNMFSHGFMSFAAIGVTVACLLIMGTFTLVAYNANRVTEYNAPPLLLSLCSKGIQFSPIFFSTTLLPFSEIDEHLVLLTILADTMVSTGALKRFADNSIMMLSPLSLCKLSLRATATESLPFEPVACVEHPVKELHMDNVNIHIRFLIRSIPFKIQCFQNVIRLRVFL